MELVALEMMFNHLSRMLRISAVCSNLPDVHVQKMIPILQKLASVEEAGDPEDRFFKMLGKILEHKTCCKAYCKEYKHVQRSFRSQKSLWL